jgi:hypothetical protein
MVRTTKICCRELQEVVRQKIGRHQQSPDQTKTTGNKTHGSVEILTGTDSKFGSTELEFNNLSFYTSYMILA